MGSDEGQHGDSWPGQASPPQESTPAPGHPAAAPSAWVAGSWSRRSLTSCPGPPLPALGRALTPTLPLVWEEAGAGAGWRVRALPRLWEKGAFVEPGPLPPPSPPTAGTFLGRGLASSARAGPWGGGQRPGWGLSMALCGRSQEASVAELTALTLQPTGPRLPSPVVQHCPHGHLPLRAPWPATLAVAWLPSPFPGGLLSELPRWGGGPGAELGCAPGGLRGSMKGQEDRPSSAARLWLICHFSGPPSASGAPQLRFLPLGILFSRPPPRHLALCL